MLKPMSLWDEFLERKEVARVSRHVSHGTAIFLAERWFRFIIVDDGSLVSLFVRFMLDLVLVSAIGMVSFIFVVGLFRAVVAFWRSNGNAAVLVGL
jgi:hypothetical protein